MTERGKRLLERDGQGWSAVLNHPLQQAARNNIEQLLSGLRACRTEADLDDFQRALFQQVVDAQTLQAKASRNVKRVRYGRPVPRSPSGDWVIDRWVADRVVRQLRSVGDALAWRMFGFDRRYLLALSRNAGPPGPFVDGIDADGEPRFKAGLERELGVVVDRWNEQRQFSLLCDLTNSIRICDVIGFSPTGPRLIEVKSSAAGERRDQLARAEHAVRVINEGAPLKGRAGGEDVDLIQSTVPLKTLLPEVRSVLDWAARQPHATVKLKHQIVLSTVSAIPGPLGKNTDALLVEAERREAKSFEKAGLGLPQQHLLVGQRVGAVDLDPGLAPYTIYPFSPWLCARLTTDFLSMKPTMAWDRLAEPFAARGFEVQPGLGRPETPGAALFAYRDGVTLTVHDDAVQQLLYELHDPDRFVQAAIETRERFDRRRVRQGSVVVFANEQSVWK